MSTTDPHTVLCRSLLVERQTPDCDRGRQITPTLEVDLQHLVKLLAENLTDEDHNLLPVRPSTRRSWPKGPNAAPQLVTP